MAWKTISRKPNKKRETLIAVIRRWLVDGAPPARTAKLLAYFPELEADRCVLGRQVWLGRYLSAHCGKEVHVDGANYRLVRQRVGGKCGGYEYMLQVDAP